LFEKETYTANYIRQYVYIVILQDRYSGLRRN